MISTHVLDTSRGGPAAGLTVVLEIRSSAGWSRIGSRATDASGRVASFSDAPPAAGTYRLTFDTGAYHRGAGVTPFFPEVTVTFDVQSGAHYHVPLLLSPYGYSTYRGT
jgi:5-hydroxyisourate hydrolase